MPHPGLEELFAGGLATHEPLTAGIIAVRLIPDGGCRRHMILLHSLAVPRHASSTPITRALSVRQPYIELILAGRKTIEYRSRATRVRERVYLYASQIPGPAEAFADAELDWQELPVGAILGSVEIIGCEQGEDFYEWQLARPRRLARPLKPIRRPQPLFFFPFGK
jgi:hypothetical protein